jgi:retron-type reverse transcriptase
MRVMARRHDSLFPRIASFQALRRAAKKALLSKRKKPGAAAFAANLEREVLKLERELREGRYKPGRYVEIELFDPKHRIVSAAPFRDRVVHHALMAQVGPIFEAGFIAQSFANRTGKGTHRAIEAYERYRHRHAFVLRCDVFRFVPAIDHAILKADFRRRIACAPTLALMDKIVDGSNPQEPVNLHFAGDDLFTPYERRRGLPIGNLTSQWFANISLDPLDHFCAEVLGAPYLRYVDDFALFADSERQLEEWRGRIDAFLARRRLKLHPRKTFIAPTSEPATFLGYELHPGGWRRMPEPNVDRARNRLRGIKHRLKAGTITKDQARAQVQAWKAQADFAHADHLQRAMLKGLPEDVRKRPRGQRRRRRKKPNGA